jgi:hypothetical protein
VTGSGGRVLRIHNLEPSWRRVANLQALDRILPGTNLIGPIAILDGLEKRNICCCCREADRFLGRPARNLGHYKGAVPSP